METVTQTMLGDRRVWRITDYSEDPTSTNTNDYDFYDLDQETLAPLRSMWSNEGSRLQITFQAKEVTLRHTTRTGAESVERVSLSSAVRPEGPGEVAFVAGLPLKVGYRNNYKIIDRWDGRENDRLKSVIISVLGEARESTCTGIKNIYT